MRQFNRTLAHKIEQNLPNCSVLSLAWHSAATYAAAAIDPSCFRGLQFPEPDGPLTGFATRIAEDCEIDGDTVGPRRAGAGGADHLRSTALPTSPKTRCSREEPSWSSMVKLPALQGTAPLRSAARAKPEIGRRLWSLLHRRRHRPPRLNPILARLAWVTLTVLLTGTWYFHAVFGGAWLDAVYFVVATMTTTGYGDLTPDRSKPVEIVVAMLLMLSGITLTGLFIAFGASLLTRVHWVTMQGLRPVHRRGHIVICGAGSIGSGVIDLLLALGKRLVVVELNPDATIVERAREQHFDLLTGDASRDTTLDLCNLAAAHSLIALTNVDTLNLEIALGARARNPTMPIVLRIAEASFAELIARHFEFETTFSAAALAAPAFVGLGRFAGSRGRVSFGGQEFAIGEIGSEDLPRTLPPDAIPIAVSRGDEFAIAHDFDALGPGGRALLLVADCAVQGREGHARRRGGAVPAAQLG